MFGVVRSGRFPVRAKERNQRGLARASGAKRSIARRFTVSGMVGTAPVPAMGEGPVERRDQPDGAGGAGPLDPRQDLVPRADPVDLEERLGAGGHHVLDGHAGERAQAHGGAPGRRRPRHGHLALGVHGLDAGRGDEDRERDLLAHHLGGQVPAVGQAGDVGREAELAEGGDVVLHRDPAFRAGDEGAVDRLGQALLGPPLGLGHRLEPLVCHSEPLVMPRSAAHPQGTADRETLRAAGGRTRREPREGRGCGVHRVATGERSTREFCKKCVQGARTGRRQNEVTRTEAEASGYRSGGTIAWLTLSGLPAPAVFAVILALLPVCWAAAYYLGGGTSVSPLWFYVPVFLAGVRFGLLGVVVGRVRGDDRRRPAPPGRRGHRRPPGDERLGEPGHLLRPDRLVRDLPLRRGAAHLGPGGPSGGTKE